MKYRHTYFGQQQHLFKISDLDGIFSVEVVSVVDVVDVEGVVVAPDVQVDGLVQHIVLS